MRVEGSGWRGPPDATALGRILVTIACLSIAAASASSPPQGACLCEILPLPPRPAPRPHAPLRCLPHCSPLLIISPCSPTSGVVGPRSPVGLTPGAACQLRA